jgi:soluble cytochrome b562
VTPETRAAIEANLGYRRRLRALLARSGSLPKDGPVRRRFQYTAMRLRARIEAHADLVAELQASQASASSHPSELEVTVAESSTSSAELRAQASGTAVAVPLDMDKTQTVVMYGALKAARAAFNQVRVEGASGAEFEDRIGEIDELLRKLARDVAKKAGL